ncbi:hypothetical protein SUGI_0433280 [Cryptomeria japonica]|nr:hypothetical protein SUGI_0433280 [Cryptomeria japonica]
MSPQVAPHAVCADNVAGVPLDGTVRFHDSFMPCCRSKLRSQTNILSYFNGVEETSMDCVASNEWMGYQGLFQMMVL